MKSSLMKRALLLLTVFVLILSLSVGTFALDLGTKDEEENLTAAEQAEKAQREAEAIANFNPNLRTLYSVYVPASRQIVGYYCGPAATYMMLRAQGVTVSSSTKSLYYFLNNENDSNCIWNTWPHSHYASYTSPQITLANNLGTTFSGTSMSSMRTVLNNRGSHGYTLSFVADNTSSANTFKSYVTSALYMDAAPAMWVEARLLQAYIDAGSIGQTFGGHYVCINSLDTSSNTVGVTDPNYWTGINTNYTEKVDKVLLAIWNTGSGSGNLLW